jgi:hypothetical protein
MIPLLMSSHDHSASAYRLSRVEVPVASIEIAAGDLDPDTVVLLDLGHHGL